MVALIKITILAKFQGESCGKPERKLETTLKKAMEDMSPGKDLFAVEI